MSERHWSLQVHGILRGRGEALDGTRVLGPVDYALRDVEEVLPASEPPRGDTGMIGLGHRNLYGVLRAPGNITLDAYVGRRFTLRLEDARQLPCTVAKVLHARMFLVQALGDPVADGVPT